jgi:PAS domain S-box-containing protein
VIQRLLRALPAWLRIRIPEGHPLPASTWRRRHIGILVLLWVHVVGLVIFGILSGSAPLHAVGEAGVVAALAVLAGLCVRWRTFAAAMACMGLLTSSALLVHFSGGYIEMHFHFFVMVGLMTLYQEWIPFLLAVGYVVVHHGLVGVLEPRSVFNHPAAWENPWGWAAIHGGFILAMSVVSLTAWRLHEVAHARGELILNSAAEGIFGVDRTGRTTFVNAATASMTGWSVDELMDRRLEQLLPAVPGASPSPWSATGETVEAVFLRKDGTAFPVQYVGAPIRERGVVAGTVVVFNDISARKQADEARTRAEEALRQAEQQQLQSQKMEAVGQLAGGIAHDFNNLLTVVIGRSDVVLEAIDRGSPLRQDVELITSTAIRAADLTRQLLAFSRQQVLRPRIVDLNVVGSGMATMLRRLIGEHIELVTMLDTGVGTVRADPTQIEQVIVNLAVNARDAMLQTGTLTIETGAAELDDEGVRGHPGATPGPYVTLTIRDSGSGMDDNVRAHLFEPFFTTKEPGKGTGLGLATVYGIIKQHDGIIVVESAVGAGTTVRIFLPRIAGVAVTAEHVPAAMARGDETILLVEDEVAVRRLADEILRRGGYTGARHRLSGRAGRRRATSRTDSPGADGRRYAGTQRAGARGSFGPRPSGHQGALHVRLRGRCARAARRPRRPRAPAGQAVPAARAPAQGARGPGSLKIRPRPVVSACARPAQLPERLQPMLQNAEASVAEPFKGISTDGRPVRGLFPISPTGVSTQLRQRHAPAGDDRGSSRRGAPERFREFCVSTAGRLTLGCAWSVPYLLIY